MSVRSKILVVPRRRFRLNRLLCVLVVLLCSSALAGTSAAAGQDAAQLGHALSELPEPVDAPNFSLRDMDENVHSLRDYRGKVVMINFWATWCPPCRREMPSMERLYQRLKDQGFIVLAVNQWESPDHVFAYTGQLEVDPSFPILFDRDSDISVAYGVKGLPTTYLLDGEGKIRYRAIGGREFDHPQVEEIIRGLLRQPDRMQ